MTETDEKKKCCLCGKTLIDETIPVCLRCRLEVRNKTGKAVSMVVAIASAIGTVVAVEEKLGKEKSLEDILSEKEDEESSDDILNENDDEFF